VFAVAKLHSKLFIKAGRYKNDAIITNHKIHIYWCIMVAVQFNLSLPDPHQSPFASSCRSLHDFSITKEASFLFLLSWPKHKAVAIFYLKYKTRTHINQHSQ